MCWACNKVIKSDSKSFSCYRRVTRRQGTRHVTRKDIDQCQNGSSNLLTPYQKQPRSARIVITPPRPVISTAKRTNHALIRFDQQIHISQDFKRDYAKLQSYSNPIRYNAKCPRTSPFEIATCNAILNGRTATKYGTVKAKRFPDVHPPLYIYTHNRLLHDYLVNPL